MFTFPVGFFGGSTGAGDPYWSNVVLYLPLTGSNGQTTFADVSQYGHAVTRNGDTVISTAQFPSLTGVSSSAYFDGSGDFLQINNAVLALGTGDFTFEIWAYSTATPSDVGIFESRDGTSGSTNGFTLTALSSSVVRIFSNGILIASSGTNYVGAWCYIAITRSSGTWNLFVNGVSQGTSTAFRDLTYQNQIVGGGRYSGTVNPNAFFTGYLSHLRITKGIARYTANFTPPTAPFPIG